MEQASTSDRLSQRDVALTLLLGLAAFALYRVTTQERLANDGPQLASVFVLVPDSVHWQVLYLPLARLLGRLADFGDPFGPLRLLGALGGGVGVGASYLLARGFGVERRFAAAAAALVAVTRHAWFFGTSIEVHSLHFGLVGVAACTTLYAPWRRPALALLVAALGFAATWTTHGTAVLLGPGWVALAGYARARVAEPFRVRTLLFVVGPVLLAALLAVMLPIKHWWVTTTGGQSDLEWNIIVAYAANTDSATFLWEGLLRPLGLLVPLIGLGLALWRRQPAGWTLAALIAPGTAFLVWWGVPEDGGYFLGHAPFHAVLAGVGLAALSRRSLILVPGVLFLQAASSWAGLRHFDARFDPAERVKLTRETVGERAFLGKIAYLAPDISIWLPEVEEVDLTGRLHQGYHEGIPARELAERVTGTIEAALAQAPVALDTSYVGESWDLAGEGVNDYVDEFVTAILERFEVTYASRESWTFAVLAPR
ncbi:MAG: hypothetical protein AAF682_11110 [Planctomycetota bacterium]